MTLAWSWQLALLIVIGAVALLYVSRAAGRLMNTAAQRAFAVFWWLLVIGTIGWWILRRIKSVEPRHGHRLAVFWYDSTSTIVDLTRDIARGGVFAPLRDDEVFDRVEIDPRHRVLQWLDPADGSTLVDIDADALFVLGEQQRTRNFMQRMLQWLHHTQPQPAGEPR